MKLLNRSIQFGIFILSLIILFSSCSDNPFGPDDTITSTKTYVEQSASTDSNSAGKIVLLCHKKENDDGIKVIKYTYKIYFENNVWVKYKAWWGKNNKLYFKPIKTKSYKYNRLIVKTSQKQKKWFIRNWRRWYPKKCVLKSIEHKNYPAVIYMKKRKNHGESIKITVYLPENIAPDDTTPPVPGNAGIITPSGYSINSQILSWEKAADETSAQVNLQYKIYYSTSDNLNSVSDVEANGTPVNDFTNDINTIEITGLAEDTTYYYNIIVMDEAGNKAIYIANSETTINLSMLTALNEFYTSLLNSETIRQIRTAIFRFKTACTDLSTQPQCQRLCEIGQYYAFNEWVHIFDEDPTLQTYFIDEMNSFTSEELCSALPPS